MPSGAAPGTDRTYPWGDEPPTCERAQFAGCEKELFSREAVALLHEASGGAHRDLDRYASLALREAARRKKKLVERDLVQGLCEADGTAAS